MKNLSLGLNIVLLVAVAVLYFLHFKSPRVTDTSDKGVKDSVTVELPELEKHKTKIAYINYDSLTKNYEFYSKGLTDLEKKYNRKQQELQTREQQFEEELYTYQQTAPSMTENHRATKEEQLMKKRDELLQLRESFGKQQLKDEESFNKAFLGKIDEYLKSLSQEKDYSYVFTYSKGGYAAIVFANDSLEITSQVVNGLNNKYKEENTKNK